jgi:prepilin-type N-terminal cleavage/methylation domain-containing protein
MARKTGKTSGGFTMIELLVVISIILVLLLILVVGINDLSTKVTATSAMIETMTSILTSYRDLYDEYPPSAIPASYPNAASVKTGAQCLYYFLMGPNGQGWGPESVNGSVPNRFRWRPPQIPLEWVSRQDGAGGAIAPFFNDGIPNETRAMLYYRASVLRTVVGQTKGDEEGASSIYRFNDNADSSPSAAGGPFWPKTADNMWWTTFGSSGDAAWEALIIDTRRAMNTQGTASVSPQPFNTNTFMLIGAGNDRVFGKAADGTLDDITNFLGK